MSQHAPLFIIYSVAVGPIQVASVWNKNRNLATLPENRVKSLDQVTEVGVVLPLEM